MTDTYHSPCFTYVDHILAVIYCRRIRRSLQMLFFTIYSSMDRSLNSKFVALALIIFSTSAFPFRDDSASKTVTLDKISSRDQTPSNDPTDDQFLGSADPVGSSLGLTADNSNQQQLIPLDGLDSAENLETLGSSSD